jgi:hypothetical protein
MTVMKAGEAGIAATIFVTASLCSSDSENLAQAIAQFALCS